MLLKRTSQHWNSPCNFACLAVVFILFLPGPLTAAEYRVGGKLKYQMAPHEQKPSLPKEFRFEVTVSNSFWYIELASANTNSAVALYQAGSDGVSVFTQAKISAAVLSKETKKSINNATGSIIATNYPSSAGGAVDVVWLAYASHAILTNNNFLSEKRLPIISILSDMPKHSSTNDCAPAYWEILEGSGGLPKFVNYLDQGFERILNREDDTILTRKRLPPFENGFISGIFTVIETTNAGGSTIPLRFKLERLIPDPQGRSNSNILAVASLEGITTEVYHTGARNSWTPAVEGISRIIDHRTEIGPSKTPARYFATNQWLSVEQSTNTATYRNQVWTEKVRGQNNQQKNQPGAKKILSVFFYIFFLLTTIPFACLYFFRKKN